MVIGLRHASFAPVAALLAVALPASAQAPLMSAGQRMLSITYEECLSRADRALRGAGYNYARAGGNFYWGTKGAHRAAIFCNVGTDGRAVIETVVASNANGSGQEMADLQRRVENPTASGGGPSSGTYQATVWRTTGVTGDCTGYDDGQGSVGPKPDPGRCNAHFVGFTAVCWTGSCTYKRIRPDACKGGASPGTMYVCGATVWVDETDKGARLPGWRPAGDGDCTGSDVGNSRGPSPETSRCTAAFAGMTAVCWGDWCTYKNVPTGSCKGGANPGRMFTCSPR